MLALGGTMNRAFSASTDRPRSKRSAPTQPYTRARGRSSAPPSRPVTGESVVRVVLVIGARESETRSIQQAFEAADASVIVARTLDAARAQLRGRRWRWVLLDARWERELRGELSDSARWYRYFVTSPRSMDVSRLPLPLTRADVDEILES